MKKLGFQMMIAALSAAALHAQTPAPASARLVARSGLVEVERGNAWVPLTIGDPLNAGERIRTAQASSAALEAGAGQVITLSERAQVQIRPTTGMPVVQLESGSMRVFATGDIQVVAKDTLLEATERPLDMEIGYLADKLNLTVINGAVRSGGITIRAVVEESRVRSYTADSRNAQRDAALAAVDPYLYMYPYFMCGNPGLGGAAPANGAIVPPVVNNPTHPGYRPTQIVPPMSDPLHVPITKQ
jgi:hypothetical protein